jgi:hypothetical protein
MGWLGLERGKREGDGLVGMRGRLDGWIGIGIGIEELLIGED